jgi:hypothetical protein
LSTALIQYPRHGLECKRRLSKRDATKIETQRNTWMAERLLYRLQKWKCMWLNYCGSISQGSHATWEARKSQGILGILENLIYLKKSGILSELSKKCKKKPWLLNQIVYKKPGKISWWTWKTLESQVIQFVEIHGNPDE